MKQYDNNGDALVKVTIRSTELLKAKGSYLTRQLTTQRVVSPFSIVVLTYCLHILPWLS